jgi:hypothetical protein
MKFWNEIVHYFKNIPFSSGGKLDDLKNITQNSETVQNVNSTVNMVVKYGLIIGLIVFVVWIIWETELLQRIYEGFMVMFWTIVFLIFFFVAMAAV